MFQYTPVFCIVLTEKCKGRCMSYHFKCPQCGNSHRFFRPQEDTHNTGCGLFLIGGLLPYGFWLSRLQRRVQCLSCGFIFVAPRPPSTPTAVLANILGVISFVGVASFVLLQSFPELVQDIPDHPLLDWPANVIAVHPRVAALTLLPALLLVFILSIVVGQKSANASLRAFHSKMNREETPFQPDNSAASEASRQDPSN